MQREWGNWEIAKSKFHDWDFHEFGKEFADSGQEFDDLLGSYVSLGRVCDPGQDFCDSGQGVAYHGQDFDDSGPDVGNCKQNDQQNGRRGDAESNPIISCDPVKK